MNDVIRHGQISRQIAIGAYQRLLNEQPANVQYRGGGAFGRCFENVERIVLRQGGKVVCGWSAGLRPISMETMRNRFSRIGLLAHAVWEDETGRLIDVTNEMTGRPFWIDPAVTSPSQFCLYFPDDLVMAEKFQFGHDGVFRKVLLLNDLPLTTS